MTDHNQNIIATTAAPAPIPQKPDALDVINNSGPLIALMIAIGTLAALYRKWKATEDKRAENRALLEKKVDDTESAQKLLEGRMTTLEDQVNDHRVAISRFETQIETIVESNKRIENRIDKIFDKIDDIVSSNSTKR